MDLRVKYKLIRIKCAFDSGKRRKIFLTRAKMNNLINVVNNLLQCCAAHCQQCCAAPCQQLLSTTIVHSCSRSTTIVQLLFFVNNEQLLIEQSSSTLSIQQVLLNLDNNIVQALFNEQRCINLTNFCACNFGKTPLTRYLIKTEKSNMASWERLGLNF